jgi:hypothetical protein
MSRSSFRCSFSGLPFHGSSVCLVLGQSVFWRGSSWGVSRGSSSWGSFFSVLMALQCKWLLIVPQDKKTKTVQPKGGEVITGPRERCRCRECCKGADIARYECGGNGKLIRFGFFWINRRCNRWVGCNKSTGSSNNRAGSGVGPGGPIDGVTNPHASCPRRCRH